MHGGLLGCGVGVNVEPRQAVHPVLGGHPPIPTSLLENIDLMPTEQQLRSILHRCIREIAEQSGQSYNVEDDTPLLGPASAVDSLGLVMIVTTFEAAVNEEFDSTIVLANEKAMSMRHSPFRSVSALSEYALGLLEGAEAA
jgi:acyl carrier protein